MNFSNISLQTCKYKVDSMQLYLPALTELFAIDPRYIANITIDYDYEKYNFPLFEISVQIPNKLVRLMKKDPTHCYVLLKMSKTIMDPEFSSNQNANAYSSYNNFIDNKFYVLLDDSTPEFTTFDEKAEEFADVAGLDYDVNNTTIMSLSLYNYDYFLNRNKIVNCIMNNANLAECVTKVLNSCGHKNVLMAPSDNLKKYSQFIITPIKGKDQLERICNDYRMHLGGTLIFYDIDDMYIINKTPKCKAWRFGENKITYLSLYRNSQKNVQAVQGCYTSIEDCYNLISVDKGYVKIINRSVVDDQVLGNDFFTINASTGEITEKYGEIDNPKGVVSLSNILINENGEDTSDNLMQRLSEAGTILNMTFSGIDIEMLTPNKEFIFALDKTDYGEFYKSYRITKASYILSNTDGYYTASAICTFNG